MGLPLFKQTLLVAFGTYFVANSKRELYRQVPFAVDKGEYDGVVARDSAAAGQPVASPLGGVMMPPSRTAAQDAEAEKRQWHSVSNADFVRYRMKASKGHDYVDVSDVRVTRLSLPIAVTF